jgi:hypothetical protein
MLVVIVAAAGVMSVLGWEVVSRTGIIKEAATLLAEAASEAFGSER